MISAFTCLPVHQHFYIFAHVEVNRVMVYYLIFSFSPNVNPLMSRITFAAVSNYLTLLLVCLVAFGDVFCLLGAVVWLRCCCFFRGVGFWVALAISFFAGSSCFKALFFVAVVDSLPAAFLPFAAAGFYTTAWVLRLSVLYNVPRLDSFDRVYVLCPF